MTVEEIKKIYIEYLSRKQSPKVEEIPVEVIVSKKDKQDK